LLPITPCFSHVKGHQDDTKEYKDLSLEAQINVDADALAGEHQTQFPSENLVAPLLPSTGAHLCIGDHTITGHYSGRIREAASLPKYMTGEQQSASPISGGLSRMSTHTLLARPRQP
jgi:hypothetical protein